MLQNPKILFSSPWGPYAKRTLEDDPIDYFYYRNTLKQKVFQLRSYQSWHSLHFLAQNINTQSVVLENPTPKQFKKEVIQNEYDIIAIGFTILLSKKVYEMLKWIRLIKPETIVILGGYGTSIFRENFEIANQLRTLSDHIVEGEGVSFLNNYLLENWKIEPKKELQQELIPARNSLFRSKIKLFEQIVVVGGLGCNFACSFCSTSSQFHSKHYTLFNPQQLIKSLENQAIKHPKIQSAIIYEEDFLLNKKMVLEFLNYYQQSFLSDKNILFTIFASLKSISQFSINELIECGIGTIFIGVESVTDTVIQEEKLIKRHGDIHKIFKELHQFGINTLGSLIIGWDSQTFDIAKYDSDQFVALNPTFYQVIPLHIVPGTALWDQLKAQSRIGNDYKTEIDGISNFNFELKQFSNNEAKILVSNTYSNLVSEGGPWPFRFFENILKGYVNLSNHPNPIYQKRSTKYEKMIFPISILAIISRVYFNGKSFKNRWNKTMKLFAKEFPQKFYLSLLISPFTLLTLHFIYWFSTLKYVLNRSGDQPDFERTEYNK